MTATKERIRPRQEADPKGLTSLHSIPDRAARQPHFGPPDASHRRPEVSPGEHLFAAQFAQLEEVATELVADWWIAQYERSATIHEQWAQRYAELNDPDQARECHSIGVALRQRCELIRIWPEDFTDTLAVLADVFAEVTR